MLYASGQRELYAFRSHELLEELNMAAVTAQLCRIELVTQHDSFTNTLQAMRTHPLLSPDVWEFCVEQLHTICSVSCAMHVQLESKPCVNLSGCENLSGNEDASSCDDSLVCAP